MSRKTDLEKSVRASYNIIREYNDIIQTSSSPLQKAKARKIIQQQWELIKDKLAQYCLLVSDTLPQDIAEIAAYFSVDFVIVTALEEERDVVLDKLPGHKRLMPSESDIRVYFESVLPATFPDGSTSTYRVIVMPLLGMGRVQATIATSDAIRRWNPRYVLLVGIAGGIADRGVKLGDILVSDQIVDYELQKLTPNGPQVRWEVHRADPRLLGAVRNFRGKSWQELMKVSRPGAGGPKRHIGPIASGDKVIAFGEVLEKYRAIWPKLIGVEMEAAGVATAAFQAVNPPGFFMVRGVSDLADEKKEARRVKKWRSYACDIAASYAIALLKSGPILPSLALESGLENEREFVRSEGKHQPHSRSFSLMPNSNSEEPSSPQSLDTRILQTLYAYYQKHPGDPEIGLNELINTCRAKHGDVIQYLHGLHEAGWVSFELAERADGGLVSLTKRGRKVAKDI